MNWKKIGSLLCLAIPMAAATAQTQPATPESIKTVRPVYSELVAFSTPKGFKQVYVDDSPSKGYIEEIIPEKETVEKWSQMITTTAARGLAEKGATAETFASYIAGNFQKACPSSFAAKALGKTQLGGHDAGVFFLGCGTASGGSEDEAHSESAMLIVVAGQQDIYTVQWAERGAASAAAPEYDNAKWQARYKLLSPNICPIVAGEKAPYPSCLGH